MNAIGRRTGRKIVLQFDLRHALVADGGGSVVAPAEWESGSFAMDHGWLGL
jgi:hypothetical protein